MRHRYEIDISRAFWRTDSGESSVNWQGTGRNLYCTCKDGHAIWMVCTITCRTQEIEDLVMDRINPNQHPDRLLPFYILRTLYIPELQNMVVYSRADCIPRVIAELQISNNILKNGSGLGQKTEIFHSIWYDAKNPR